jgi:hypothetical protein
VITNTLKKHAASFYVVALGCGWATIQEGREDQAKEKKKNTANESQ